MSVLALQETIASLIDLAEQGEISPWDVRVLEVLDRYFQALQSAIAPLPGPAGKTLYDLHLSQSAQAFVSAAMLVLLKANHLTAAEFPPLPLEEDTDDDLAAAEAQALGRTLRGQLPKHLEDWIVRRGVAVPPGRRAVSLPEMIAQLQAVAASLAQKPVRSRAERSPSRGQKIRAIRQLAHHENLEEVAAAIDAFLQQQVRPPSPSANLPDPAPHAWSFDALIEALPRSGPQAVVLAAPHSEDPGKSERAAAFWALLLLASQSKVELSQAEFYGELQVTAL